MVLLLTLLYQYSYLLPSMVPLLNIMVSLLLHYGLIIVAVWLQYQFLWPWYATSIYIMNAV
jgi:hypothetical protein